MWSTSSRPCIRTLVAHPAVVFARRRPSVAALIHHRGVVHRNCSASTTSNSRTTSASSTTRRAGYKVLFFGSDHFSIPSLRALHENSALAAQRRPPDSPADNQPPQPPAVSELAVVTSFKGTDNAVRKYIKATGLPTHHWPLEQTDDGGGGGGVALCRQFDVGVVVSFGHLIPEPLIDAFPL